MKDYILSIKGMTCDSCRMHVQEAIENTPGVLESHVSLITNTAHLVLENNTELETILKNINKTGYKANIKEDLEQTNNDLGYTIKSILMGFIFLFLGMMFAFNVWDDSLKNLSLHHWIVIKHFVEMSISLIILFLGRRILRLGFTSLFHLAPNMYALISLGVSAGFIYSFIQTIRLIVFPDSPITPIFFDAINGIMVFIMLGKYIESLGKMKTFSWIDSYIKAMPKKVNLYKNSESVEVFLSSIKIGDILVIKPGDQIPLDGILYKGEAEIDESLISGESNPVTKKLGSTILAGTYNTNTSFQLEVIALKEKSYLSQIMNNLLTLEHSKNPVIALVDKISRVFVPLVIFLAIFAYIFWLYYSKNSNLALQIAISVLVVACPCALGLATPVAVTLCVSMALRMGAFFSNTKILDSVNTIDTILFDKTGTLTIGKPSVIDFKCYSRTQLEVLEISYVLEQSSNHPISYAISNYSSLFIEKKNLETVSDFNVIAGKGVKGYYKGQKVEIGSEILFENLNVNQLQDKQDALKRGATPLFLSVEGEIIAFFAVIDKTRDFMKDMIKKLQNKGIQITLLSGDATKVVEKLAQELGIQEFRAESTPYNKLEFIENLQTQGKKVLMVGDGLNDSLSLQKADFSIAIQSGNDISKGIADIILNGESLYKLPYLFKLIGKTKKIITQNLFWAFFYNLCMIPLALGLLREIGLPFLDPIVASFAMVVSSVTVILNSLRILRVRH